jgi:hypothetical protein
VQVSAEGVGHLSLLRKLTALELGLEAMTARRRQAVFDAAMAITTLVRLRVWHRCYAPHPPPQKKPKSGLGSRVTACCRKLCALAQATVVKVDRVVLTAEQHDLNTIQGEPPRLAFLE